MKCHSPQHRRKACLHLRVHSNAYYAVVLSHLILDLVSVENKITTVKYTATPKTSIPKCDAQLAKPRYPIDLTSTLQKTHHFKIVPIPIVPSTHPQLFQEYPGPAKESPISRQHAKSCTLSTPPIPSFKTPKYLQRKKRQHALLLTNRGISHERVSMNNRLRKKNRVRSNVAFTYIHTCKILAGVD